MKKDALLLRLNLVVQALYGLSFEKYPNLESLEKIFKANLEINPEEDEPQPGLEESDQSRALTIGKGIYENRECLDAMIRGHLRGWKLERLGLLELLLLRLGIYLLMFEKWKEKQVRLTLAALARAYGLERAISLLEGVIVSCNREALSETGLVVSRQD